MTTETTEQLQCSRCKELVDSLCDNNMCEKCDSEHYECDNCGSLNHIDDMYEVSMTDLGNKLMVCQSCYNETFTCRHCREEILGDYVDVDGYEWCVFCAEHSSTVCERCGMHTTNYVEVECQYGSEVWCEGCAEYRSIICSECDTRHHDDIECPECGGGGGDGIMSYDYKPRPVFIGDGDRFFGVELEVEAISGHGAFNIPESGDYSNVYYKHDGSLDNGYEIVTHPHTLDAFYKSYENESGLFGAIDALQGKARSHNTKTCGLHIHVSRPSPMTVAKMVSFFAANIHAFEVLCRRKTGQYCRLDDVPMVDKNNSDCVYGSSRYGAIADRGCTIELRLPKGTLKASTVMATIEMYDALIKYCEVTPVMQLNIDGFLKLCGAYKFLPEYDRYKKMLADGAPDRCRPRNEIPKPKPPAPEPHPAFDFIPPPSHAEDGVQGDLQISYDAGGYAIGTTASGAFLVISTARMDEYRGEIIDCADRIASAVGFLANYSIVDAVLIATVNKFSALGWDIDRICELAIPAHREHRVREIFSNVQ